MVWTTRRSVAVPAWQTRSVVGAGVCALALAALLAPAAFAQRAVISIAPDSPFSQAYTQSWLAEPWRLEWSEPWLLDGSPASNPVFTADGRYLVYPWPGGAPTRLRIQDIVTRGVVELPVPFLPVRAHPRVPAVFGMLVEASSGWTAARLDPGGLHVAAGCAAGATRALDLTVDGAVLVTLCTSGEVFVLDAASGAVLRQVTGGTSQQVMGLVADADASHVLVARAGSTLARGIARVDTVTGVTLGLAAFPVSDCVAPQLAASSADRRRVVVTCWWPASPPGSPTSVASSARILDVDTLTWGLDLGLRYAAGAVQVSPDGRTVFAYSQDPVRGFGAIQVIDAATGQSTVEVLSWLFGMVVAFPPLAPALTAAVTGQRVDLAWQDPAASPAATSYLLEIGSASGAADLGVVALDAGRALTVLAAPPGRYFVRVRGVNAAGAGAPSPDVLVLVP